MTVRSDARGNWDQVSVVIPALNEARNLPAVLAALPADVHEVIVVDGHSVDGTLAVAKQLRPEARILVQSRRGKGNALACGFAAATGDIIAMVDADGSADPHEIPRFVAALHAGADFAKGSRFAPGGGSSDLTRLRSAGNRALSAVVNARYGTHYTDLCYGFNAFWRRHVPVLGLDTTAPAPAGGEMLWGDGFEVETLIHIRVAAAGLEVTEVPSFEHQRQFGASNLRVLRDGTRVLRTILTDGRCPASRPSPQRARGGHPVARVAAPAAAGPPMTDWVVAAARDEVTLPGGPAAHAQPRPADRPGGSGAKGG